MTAPGQAVIDPIFSINPSFANADQYSIVLSPGIGNGKVPSGIPEPSAWMMMMLGFGALGAVARSRRQAAYAV